MSALARPAAALLAGALTVALSACGAGFEANTYDGRNLDDATNTDIGRIALRNVYVASPDEGIVHPAGSDARLQLVIANNSDQPDRLVSVTTEAAASAQILVDGRRTDSLQVPPSSLSDPTLEVQLTGLTRDLRSGEYVSVRVQFETNGAQEFQVPIGSPRSPEEKEHSKVLHGEEEH